VLPELVESLAQIRAELEKQFEDFCKNHKKRKKLSYEMTQSIIDFRLEFLNDEKYEPDFREEWHKIQATKTLK
jgi:hypothetical protein